MITSIRDRIKRPVPDPRYLPSQPVTVVECPDTRIKPTVQPIRHVPKRIDLRFMNTSRLTIREPEKEWGHVGGPPSPRRSATPANCQR